MLRQTAEIVLGRLILPLLTALCLSGAAPPSVENQTESAPGGAEPAVSAPAPVARRCPPEMVEIDRAYCIDRWELSLFEQGSTRRVSPYYHPSRFLALRDQREWENRRGQIGPWSARQVPLPELPAWETQSDFDIRAESKPGVVPNAYLDLASARRACANAGKRLCRHGEWLKACRSELNTRHPYGERLVPGACNLNAPQAPAPLLHGAAGLGHRDPRLNEVEYRGERLLSLTGSHPECRSAWGDDAVMDMVGGLDEWIDDDSGVFLGGFYARDTPHGCQARITVHRADYYDYSLGARCCESL
ncbi:MAG: hypothetical protein AB7K71_27035 [Polyangiaceae bacterium]